MFGVERAIGLKRRDRGDSIEQRGIVGAIADFGGVLAQHRFLRHVVEHGLLELALIELIRVEVIAHQLHILLIALVVGVTELRLLDLLATRSEEHTSELQSLMRISYAVFCLKKKTNDPTQK